MSVYCYQCANVQDEEIPTTNWKCGTAGANVKENFVTGEIQPERCDEKNKDGDCADYKAKT